MSKAKLGLLVVAIDGLFFSLVSPTSNNSAVIIIGSLFLALTFYTLLALIVSLLATFVSIPDPIRKRLVLSATLLLTFTLVMQSIGQLDFRDILAAMALVTVLYFYLAYTSKTANSKSA